jgi:REP element-mobilizing transposase RayT
MPDKSHRHWFSRGYLPHLDAGAVVQSVTFRLADSLPREVLERLKTSSFDDAERFRFIEALIDRGSGSAVLRHPEFAGVVENALKYFDGERYRLLAWVIMPNHVHVLIEQVEGFRLDRILHAWKSFTANRINMLRGVRGRLWAREYYDRFIRDPAHFESAVAYIRSNPVKAGLVARAEDWPWLGPTGASPGAPASCRQAAAWKAALPVRTP